MNRIGTTLAALTLTLTAAPAFADGLAVRTAKLSPAARASLAAEIAADRKARPDSYRAVFEVRGIQPEVYLKYQNPKPNAAHELRAMGASALLPMLSALAFDGPSAVLTDPQRAALTVGMLEAVGLLRDPRSGPVLSAALESGTTDAQVLRAAAEALGRLCGDADLSALTRHAVFTDPLHQAAVHGLGQCRRVEAAKHLGGLLATAPDDATTELVAGALGTIGSSWAWKALGPSVAATGLAVREIAARALVSAFPLRSPAARQRIGVAMMLVEHPVLPELLSRAHAEAPAELRGEILTLKTRIERALAH
ncbi:hypothetical protein A7982_13218 [Minicystis rosea]|nr:hypothetical protein A7982_13218 [Minicystis rosea]